MLGHWKGQGHGTFIDFANIVCVSLTEEIFAAYMKLI